MDTESMEYYHDRQIFQKTLTSKADFVGKAINMFMCPCPLDKLADGKYINLAIILNLKNI